MTISYTSLLGLAQPVTGTETGQWGTVVNDEITALLEDAVANSASISVTAGNVTLSTTNGSSNQARMATLIITGTPGATRNVVAPSQAKIYVVINQSDGAVVIKGAATSGVTIGAGQTAQVAWNGSDFVEIGNYVHGNFVVNGNLSVNGDSTLGNAGADTTTINGQVIAANSNISKTTTLSASAPALAWIKGATYTDTGTAGGTTQALAPFTVFSAPTLSTSNIVTYTNAATVYVAGAPAAAGSATITNPYALYVAAGDAYFGASVVLNAGTAYGVPYLSSPGKVLTTGSALTFDGTALTVGANGLYLSGNTGGSAYMSTYAASTATELILGTSGNIPIRFIQSNSEVMRLTSTGLKASIAGTNADPVFSYTSDTNTGIFFPAADKLGFVAGGGSDQMVLTTTGLGIGTNNPGAKLDVAGSTNLGNDAQTTYVTRISGYGVDSGGVRYGSYGQLLLNATATYTSSARRYLITNSFELNKFAIIRSTDSITDPTIGVAGAISSGTADLVLDSSGNLGLGVTPSAWLGTSGRRAIEIGALGNALFSNGASDFYMLSNAFRNSAANFIYANNGLASAYQQPDGQHRWYTAPSGTAGDPITFTQTMTLDASGNLLVGTTSPLTSASGRGNVTINGTDAVLAFGNSNSSAGYIYAVSTNLEISATSTRFINFLTNGTERARITSGGYFKASNDGNYSGVSAAYHELYQSADADTVRIRGTNAAFSNNVLFVGADRNTTNGSFNAIAYYNFGASAYRFYVADSGNVTNTNGSYGTISDAKMKTDIVDAGSQWSDIKALRFRKFKMINDPSNLVQLGVVAQEVELTSPGLVDEHADKDAEGNDLGTTTKSVKTSVLLMKAAVALQEAMTRIEQLEAKVAALQGA